jgi:hypothetical protein
MTKIVPVPYAGRADECPMPGGGDFPQTNPDPSAQDVPASGLESGADDKSVFEPNLDLAIP